MSARWVTPIFMCVVLLTAMTSPGAAKPNPGGSSAGVSVLDLVAPRLNDGGDCLTGQIIEFAGPDTSYGTKSKMRFKDRAVTNCQDVDVQTESAVVIHKDETHLIWFGWGIPPGGGGCNPSPCWKWFSNIKTGTCSTCTDYASGYLSRWTEMCVKDGGDGLFQLTAAGGGDWNLRFRCPSMSKTILLHTWNDTGIISGRSMVLTGRVGDHETNVADVQRNLSYKPSVCTRDCWRHWGPSSCFRDGLRGWDGQYYVQKTSPRIYAYKTFKVDVERDPVGC